MYLRWLNKILSGNVMASSKDFERLKKIQKRDFGSYLNLVESVIYDTECVKSRYEENIKIFSKVKRNAKLLFAFFLLMVIACPIFLFIATFYDALTFEKVAYTLWLVLGLVLIKPQYTLYTWTSRKAETNIISLNKGYNLCLKYIKDTLGTFYNREEFFTPLTEGMAEEELDTLKNWVLVLEMDFTVFTDHVYKNNRLNNLPEDKAQESAQDRENSHSFLVEYLDGLSVK